jgi:YVTN family beta-propeller protein
MKQMSYALQEGFILGWYKRNRIGLNSSQCGNGNMKRIFMSKRNWMAWCGAMILGAEACQAEGPYSFVKEIPVPGNGGWDYCSVDAGARRLYVSHGSNVVVIDIENDQVAGEIRDTLGVHGVALAPELKRGVVTCGREGKAAIVDLGTLQTITKVETGQNPDGMLYNPGTQEAYVFNGRSRSATVINVKEAKVTATIDLGGKPEFGAADPAAGMVYDNLEDRSEIVAIDTRTHAVTSRWPVAPGEEPSGMAIDAAHHHLFVGCRNQKMLMVDGSSGKILADVPIGEGVDATAFDPGTGLAFASCGDGTTTIAKEEGDTLRVVQTLTTEPRARTMALDPKTHRIYLASARFEAPAANGDSGGGRRRPRMIPGTFKILVYGMNEKGRF